MNRRSISMAVVLSLAGVSILFMVGVFAGWWPYLWWEAFR